MLEIDKLIDTKISIHKEKNPLPLFSNSFLKNKLEKAEYLQKMIKSGETLFMEIFQSSNKAEEEEKYLAEKYKNYILELRNDLGL